MDGYAGVRSVVHCLIIDNKYSTVRYRTVYSYNTNIPRDSSINFLHT